MKLCVVLLLVAVAAQPVRRKHKHPVSYDIECVVPFDGTRPLCVKGGAETHYYYNTQTKECRYGYRGCEPDRPLQGEDCYLACNKTEETVREP